MDIEGGDDSLKSNKTLRWEIAGIFFLVLVGSLLHFCFEWSGGMPLVGIFAPVNESVWEHLKLGFWALLFFSLIEYRFIKQRRGSFLLAKALAVLALQGFVLVFHYFWEMLAGKAPAVLEILAYVTGCVICQTVSYLILTRTSSSKTAHAIGLTLLLLHALLLILFTFSPPRLEIFQDPKSLNYGIYEGRKNMDFPKTRIVTRVDWP